MRFDVDTFSISNLRLWISSRSSRLCTDTSGTTTAASGDTVRYVGDLSSAGNHLTQAGTAPTLATESGLPVLAFTSAQSLAVTASTTPSIGSATVSSFTLHAVVRAVPTGTDPGACTLMSFNQGGGTVAELRPWWTADIAQFADGAGGSLTLGASHCVLDEWHVVSYVFTGSTIRTFVDMSEIAQASVVAPTGVATVASFARNQFVLNGGAVGSSAIRVAELIIAESAQTTLQIRAIQRDLRRKHAALFDPEIEVLFIGNSLSNGGFSGVSASLPRLVNAAIGTQYTVDNHSRGGVTGALLAQHVAGDTIWPMRRAKVCVIWETTNSIVVTGDGGIVAANWNISLAQRALAAGCQKIVLGTCLPRTGMSNTTRDNANTQLRLFAASDPSRISIADVAANTTIGENGDDLNATYYSDGIHLTAAGNAVAEPIFTAAINAALAAI
jgi:hypothetical protein